MKKYLFLTLVLFSLNACVSMQGKEDYIPIGPQNLSIQVQDGKDLPMFTHVTQITRPWSNIGVQRIKNLPNDPKVVEASILRLKRFAAAHGANAILIKQYFDEDNTNHRPITLATNLVRYVDDISEEDMDKITKFAQTAELGE
ncbi:MAG: hypothetical protein J5594_00415 [Elusimicrobiaceae bacterium]|nr:hypothetical protein [Elusimicrobiaceae bacterium]